MKMKEQFRQMALTYLRNRLTYITEEIAYKRRECCDILKRIRELEGKEKAA